MFETLTNLTQRTRFIYGTLFTHALYMDDTVVKKKLEQGTVQHEKAVLDWNTLYKL